MAHVDRGPLHRCSSGENQLGLVDWWAVGRDPGAACSLVRWFFLGAEKCELAVNKLWICMNLCIQEKNDTMVSHHQIAIKRQQYLVMRCYEVIYFISHCQGPVIQQPVFHGSCHVGFACLLAHLVFLMEKLDRLVPFVDNLWFLLMQSCLSGTILYEIHGIFTYYKIHQKESNTIHHANWNVICYLLPATSKHRFIVV